MRKEATDRSLVIKHELGITLSDPPAAVRRTRWLREMVGLLVVYGLLVILSTRLSPYGLLTNAQYIIPVMMAVGLALMWGNAGVLSFGQSLFYGLGGYAYGVVAINTIDIQTSTNLALVVGIAIPTLAALIIGWFVFFARLSSVYVAIIMFVMTLAVGSFMSQTAGPQWRIGRAFLGGTNGLGSSGGTVVSPPSLSFGIGSFHLNLPSDGYEFFLLVLTLAFGTIAAARAISLSRWGLILRSIKENAARSEAMGYDSRVAKMGVFVFGGLLAGLSGVLFVSWGNFITPDVFGVTAAVLPVLWVTVGGVESIVASAMAAAGLSWLTLYLGTQGNLSNVVIGALLVFVAVVARRGPGPTLAEAFKKSPLSRNLQRLVGVVKPRSVIRDAASDDASGGAGAVSGAEQKDTQKVSTRTSQESRSGTGRSVLRVEGITKSWRGVSALTDVSFSVSAGEILSIIGPNGAGKSTLLKCITGDVAPDKGRVQLGEDNVVRSQKHLRARSGIGIKYQNGGVYPSLTVAENLELATYSPARRRSKAAGGGGAPHGSTGLASSESLLPPEIQRIHEQRGNMPLGNLPHGEQQLVEIGMALECAPRLLILDEPVAGLSVGESAKVAELIKLVARRYNMAVIVTEHDMEFVRELGAPLIVLHRGSVLARGSYEEIMSRADVRDVYLKTKPDSKDSARERELHVAPQGGRRHDHE